MDIDNDDGSSSELGEEELENMVRQAEQKGTVRQTKWAVKKFEDWMTKRKVEVNMREVEPAALSGILKRFYGEVRGMQGSDLSPSTLVGIRAGLQRHMSDLRSDGMDITKDPAFSPANKVFKAKCRLYSLKGGPKVQHKEQIAARDLEKINEYLGGQTITKDPRQLQQAVWFIIAFNMGCRGREIYRQLKKQSFGFHTDDMGQEYCELQQSVVEKNHTGGAHAEEQYDLNTRIYDTQVGGRSALSLLRLYISKLHPDCEWMFQQSRPRPGQDDLTWYKKEPLGVNTLGDMMPRISASAGLSRRYTNHCVRSTTVGVLFHAGVQTQSIMARTGHRSVESLQHYVGMTTSSERRHEARLLESALQGTTAGTLSQSRRSVIQEAGQGAGDGSRTMQLEESLQIRAAGASRQLFGGTYTNCTFHINISDKI